MLYEFSNIQIQTLTNYYGTGMGLNSIHTYKFDFNQNIYVDETYKSSLSTSGGYGDVTWYVFGSHAESNLVKARLYFLKMYKDNELVRDFIPVKDLSGTACLFDRVTHTHFYNAGTGTFTPGPEIGG